VEGKFFDWQDWDVLDDGMYQYYTVELKQDIGIFHKGEQFDVGIVDYQHGVLTLQRGKNAWKFHLRLEIGDAIRDETSA